MALRPTIIALLPLVLCACQQEQWDDCITSTGPASSEQREVAGFRTIELHDRIDLVLDPGTVGRVAVSGGRNLLDQVRTEVVAGTLRISNANTCNWVRSFKPRITVRASSVGLERLVLRGTGDVTCADTLRAPFLAVEQWGAQGTARLMLAVNTLEVGLHTGAGDAVLLGRCTDEARLYSGIMAPIDASGLRASRVAVNNSGITDIRCWAEDELHVFIGDAGDVLHRGDPPLLHTDIRGSGRVLRLP